jgi:alanyl-tRNA synthetase
MDTPTTLKLFDEFFRHRGHRRIRGSSLIPPDPNDTVLFVTSGMHPLIPYLQGRPHPQGRRLHNLQRCLRTTDLDEVGDGSHLTVFEMLGSWSLGDYDHSQSLRWGWELLTDGFGLCQDRLGVTIFGGDERCDPDTDSERTWRELGLPESRITATATANWWEGPDGICGPDSELFVWADSGQPTGDPTTDERWIEVWNHVSLSYRDTSSGRVELPLRCVDTGMGFERLVMILQGAKSVYETDLFVPWTSELCGRWRLDPETLRRLADHLRSCAVIVFDGVRPDNTGRGYVLRRLLRRVLVELWENDSTASLRQLDKDVVSHTLDHLGGGNVEHVLDVFHEEECRFRRLVDRGHTLVERELVRGPLTDDRLRWLHETHGLPRDLVLRLVDRLKSGHGGDA